MLNKGREFKLYLAVFVFERSERGKLKLELHTFFPRRKEPRKNQQAGRGRRTESTIWIIVPHDMVASIQRRAIPWPGFSDEAGTINFDS